jgi:hypothetical protein
VRNRGVGEQTLGVRLRERREVAAGHGGDRDDHNDRDINRAQRIQAIDQYAQQQRPCRRLHRHRHETGNAGRRAFVCIRRPLMKGDGGDLEQQSDHRRQQRQHHHRIARILRSLRRHRARNHRQVGAAGNAVEQRKSVGKDARRKCPQQQILQRRFVRAPVAAQKTHQNVGGNRHQLKPDKEQHDVDPRRHAHHTHHGKQQQRIVFAVLFVLPCRDSAPTPESRSPLPPEKIPEIDGEAVHKQRVVEPQRPPGRQRRLNLPHAHRREHTPTNAPTALIHFQPAESSGQSAECRAQKW